MLDLSSDRDLEGGLIGDTSFALEVDLTISLFFLMLISMKNFSPKLLSPYFAVGSE